MDRVRWVEKVAFSTDDHEKKSSSSRQCHHLPPPPPGSSSVRGGESGKNISRTFDNSTQDCDENLSGSKRDTKLSAEEPFGPIPSTSPMPPLFLTLLPPPIPPPPTSNVFCAADTHHIFNRVSDKTVLTASDVVLHSEAFDSDNDNSSTQHHRPRHDCCLPTRFRTSEYVPTTASCTPARSRLLASELVDANSAPPSNDDEFDTRNTNNALQQLDISSILGARE